MAKAPDEVVRRRGLWRWNGSERPPFAATPGPGQESVWDYPRPPRVEPERRTVIVRVGDVVLAETRGALRVLETASPPTVYLPPEDVDLDRMRPAEGNSICEWRGAARYGSVVLPDRTLESVAWTYPDPYPEFAALAGYVSFYPARVECFVDDVRVAPQPGRFYGGWVTPELVGPFKGDPGSESW